MTLKEILFSLGLTSSEIKQNNILLNNEKIQQTDLKLEFDSFEDSGNFIFKNIEIIRPISFINFDDLFSCDIPYIKSVLSNYSLLRTSKKQTFILKKYDN